METDTGKIALGAVLLVISSALILGTGLQEISLPVWTASIAALGLAAGALFVGTAGDGRPV